jgi:hypothetical protein
MELSEAVNPVFASEHPLRSRLVNGLPEAERGHGAKRSPAASLDEPDGPVETPWERPARVAGLVAIRFGEGSVPPVRPGAYRAGRPRFKGAPESRHNLIRSRRGGSVCQHGPRRTLRNSPPMDLRGGKGAGRGCISRPVACATFPRPSPLVSLQPSTVAAV